MTREGSKEISLLQAALPILFLLVLIVYGLILRPHVFEQSPFPLEIVFIFASCLAIGQQLVLPPFLVGSRRTKPFVKGTCGRLEPRGGR